MSGELDETPPVEVRHPHDPVTAFMSYAQAKWTQLSAQAMKMMGISKEEDTNPHDHVKASILHKDHSKHGETAVPHNEVALPKEPKLLLPQTPQEKAFLGEAFFWELLFPTIQIAM